MDKQISTGYIYKPHAPEEFLGAEFPVINPGGHWLNYAPTPNVQQNTGMEAEDCTSQGTLDCVETMLRFLFNDQTAWSKRYLAWASGTTPAGNEPGTVANALSSKGTVPHADWPQTPDLTTWALLYATPPQSIQTKALEFPAQYSVVARPVPWDVASLKANLEISPLGVAGFAWAQDNNGLYYSPAGTSPCHWFTLLDYELDETQPNGLKWVVFDSYEQNIKYLRGDYVFYEAIQYQIVKNVGNTIAAQSAWQSFLSWMSVVLQQTLGYGEYSPDRLLGAARSPEWPRVRREFAKYVPAVCPFSGKTSVQLHHSQAAFHADPTRELDPTQLRWVAQGYHIEEGHNGDFKSLNFTFDERLDEYQARKYWNGSAWVPNDKPRIKYKLTPEELLEWNQTFGTSWVYPS